jgi:hypothetical protein
VKEKNSDPQISQIAQIGRGKSTEDKRGNLRGEKSPIGKRRAGDTTKMWSGLNLAYQI